MCAGEVYYPTVAPSARFICFPHAPHTPERFYLQRKKDLLWSIDRSKRGSQLDDFVFGVDELHFEMSHLKKLEEWWLWRFLSRHKAVFFESTFFIACLQNIVLLVRYSESTSEVIRTTERVANSVMGTLQVLSCILVFVAVTIQMGPLLLKRAKLWHTDAVWDEWLRSRARLTQINKTASCCKKAKLMVIDWSKLYLEKAWLVGRVIVILLNNLQLALMLAALLGLFVSPLWFSVHLVDVIAKSKDLQYVFRSVTTHGKSILWTAFFGIIVIYIYAAAGYGLVPRAFKQTTPSPAFDGVEGLFGTLDRTGTSGGDFESDETQSVFDRGRHGGRSLQPWRSRLTGQDQSAYCDTLLYCWLASVNEGLRAGDIGAIMHSPDPDDEWYQYLIVLVFQLSFYCGVITVILSVVFGIIIDTFSQLRTEEQENTKHMNGRCFICDVDRLTLDRQGGGFEKHIQADHNMWLCNQISFRILPCVALSAPR